MPFTLFQQLKAFVTSLITAAGDTTEKKIITVDVEAGMWNGLRVEDLSPLVTVHSPTVTVYSPKGFGVNVK